MLYLVKRSLRAQILRQVSDRVAFYLHGGGIPGESGCSGGVDARRMVHEVGRKGRILNLRILQISGQLVNNGADHLKMPQFLGTYKRVKMEPEQKNARIARGSGSLPGRKPECADSGIPVFHGHGAGGDTAKGEACVADRCLCRRPG